MPARPRSVLFAVLLWGCSSTSPGAYHVTMERRRHTTHGSWRVAKKDSVRFVASLVIVLVTTFAAPVTGQSF